MSNEAWPKKPDRERVHPQNVAMEPASTRAGSDCGGGNNATKLVVEFQSAVHTLLRHGVSNEQQARQCLAAAVCSLEQLGDVGTGASSSAVTCDRDSTSTSTSTSTPPGEAVTPRHGLLSTSTLQPFLELLLNIVCNNNCGGHRTAAAKLDQNCVQQLAVILLTYVCRYWTVPETSVGFPVQLRAGGASPRTASGSFILRCWAALFHLAKSTPRSTEVHALCKYFYYSVPTIGIADNDDSKKNSPSGSRSVEKVLQLVPTGITRQNSKVIMGEHSPRRSLRVDLAVLHRLATHLVASEQAVPPPQGGGEGGGGGGGGGMPGSRFHIIARHLFSIVHSSLELGRSGTRDEAIENSCIDHQPPVCYLLPPQWMMNEVNVEKTTAEPDLGSIGPGAVGAGVAAAVESHAKRAGSKGSVQTGTASPQHRVEVGCGCCGCFLRHYAVAQFPKNLFRAPLWALAVDELQCYLSHLWGMNDDVVADVILAHVGTRDTNQNQERRGGNLPVEKRVRRQLSSVSSDIKSDSADAEKGNPKPHGVLHAVEDIISSSFVVLNDKEPSTLEKRRQKERAHQLMRGIALWKCLVCLLGRRLCRPAQPEAPVKRAELSSLTRENHRSHADAATTSYAQRYVTAVLRPLAEVTRFLRNGMFCARVFADGPIPAPTACPFDALNSLSALQHILAAWQVGAHVYVCPGCSWHN